MKVEHVLLVLYCASLIFATRVNKSERIFNGKKVSIEDYPHQVHYLALGCGGSILNKNTVLTAGHCVPSGGGGHGKIRVGSEYAYTGGQLMEIAKVSIHPKYQMHPDQYIDYDFAILKLAKDLKFDKRVQPIRLGDSSIPERSELFVTGWGRTKEGGPASKTLLGATVRRVSLKRCRNSYMDNRLTEVHICAIGRKREDACNGDSGGPLTFNNTLVGVVSFGVACGQSNIPGVYARVAEVLPWIEFQMEDGEENYPENEDGNKGDHDGDEDYDENDNNGGDEDEEDYWQLWLDEVFTDIFE